MTNSKSHDSTNSLIRPFLPLSPAHDNDERNWIKKRTFPLIHSVVAFNTDKEKQPREVEEEKQHRKKVNSSRDMKFSLKHPPHATHNLTHSTESALDCSRQNVRHRSTHNTAQSAICTKFVSIPWKLIMKKNEHTHEVRREWEKRKWFTALEVFHC